MDVYELLTKAGIEVTCFCSYCNYVFAKMPKLPAKCPKCGKKLRRAGGRAGEAPRSALKKMNGKRRG